MIDTGSQWKWFGNAGHFICARWCQFHLTTQVGKWLISTVGQYLPSESMREIFADNRGIELEGKGDARRNDYTRKIGFEEIGYNRTFETMVFLAGDPCVVDGCNCGLPLIDGSEIDSNGYDTAGDATAGHMAMCEKYAEKRRLEAR